MELNRLEKQIEFIKEIDKLKYIERKTKLFNSDRRENDAEHSWHLSIMAIILEEHSNENIDILKVLKMLLIHDIVEIDAGDTFLFDTTKNHVNTIEEFVAAKRVFGILPKNQAENLIVIWKEFEEGKTNEAKFAKAMDRFQPVLQNQSNNGGSWFEFNINFENIIKKTKTIKLGSNTIWLYVEKTIKALYNE
ncbi:HD family hydrolase [Mariniflexile gromovii]|uniref:HD domain-containing protein n=1 Tax=Mariniflexile gromovii TaxID=362523 RepID=A0ABS4BVG8_9FLAO|nr:HD domain-containing protein [Mariniflexile gromovii]MBP0904075.1 HD domain-containing protein [Mariniflexile gromovii]